MPINTASQQSQLTDTERALQEQFARLEQQFAQLREQTRQAQKLASLGTAAAMLAHEFNNLMTPVKGYAQYAIDAQDQELMDKALRITLKQIGIISAMSDRILGLAANEGQTVKKVNVAEAVADARECLIRDLSKDSIKLTVDVDSSLSVLANPQQLQQVFFNLLINARQAIKSRGGRITIAAERVDEEFIAIRVSDTGCGMSADELENIFEAFYSTKGTPANGTASVGTSGTAVAERARSASRAKTSAASDRPSTNGLGLGLALCRDIVEEHRGRITCESEPGEGTTFIIHLPSAD